MLRYTLAKCALFCIEKPLSTFFLHIVKNLSEKKFERIFFFLFNSFGYFGNLKTDLERYIRAGNLRVKCVKARGTYSDPRNPACEEPTRIGILGSLASEANLSKYFFSSAPENIQVVIFNIVKNRGPDTTLESPTHLHTGKENISSITICCGQYTVDLLQVKALANLINEWNLDVLVSTLMMHVLPILDNIEVPRVISLNPTSLPVPHPKCTVQSFVQPPWPYKAKDGLIFNIKTQTPIPDVHVDPDLFSYNPRATKSLEKVPLFLRRRRIFFSGNLKKLNEGCFYETLVDILYKIGDVEFFYWGSHAAVKSVVQHKLKYSIPGVRCCYRGEFRFHPSSNLNDFANRMTREAMEDLRYSRLMLNSFPMGGARTCIEAYCLGVPVIHLEVPEVAWLKNRALQYYKIPRLVTSAGTARSVQEYIELASEAFHDDRLANRIIDEQSRKLEVLLSHECLWTEITKRP